MKTFCRNVQSSNVRNSLYLTTAWKCARRLVNSQIQSKLGCKGERSLYLNWNGIPINCLVLVSSPTITGTTTTTATTTTTTTTVTITSYYYNDDDDNSV